MPALGERPASALGWMNSPAPRAMVVVAHPDDETIALGAHLSTLPGVLIVHATDGAPRDLNDGRAQGFADAGAYASARRSELRGAMRIAGISETALIGLGYADQEAAFSLVDLSTHLADLFDDHEIEIVFTHAYEGGHPDHDATAFATHAAVALSRRRRGREPLLIEAPLYHAKGGETVRQRFIAIPGTSEIIVELSPASREQKALMFACHATQRETLKLFHWDNERFRRAPAYYFSEAPNGGEILYDGLPWRLKSARFIELAREALRTLDLPPCL
jgi:LmbE family N-acetylglucosaminyl deacetylase